MSQARAMRRFAAHWMVALLGCVDFGYSAQPFELEEAPDDAGGDCVEGAAPPRTDGPQVRFVTMDVDLHSLTISVGEVVTWTNDDTLSHDVTAGAPNAPLASLDGGFYSGVLQPGAAWAYRFCEARAVPYFCEVHKDTMSGYQVVVE